MMQEFIEKNRTLLKVYYRVALIGGWIFISLAALSIAGHSVALLSRIGDWSEFVRYYYNDVPWGTFSNGLPSGLLALGIAQFIIYLLNPDNKAGWVLRNGYRLIYLYTAILVVYYCWLSANEVILHFNEPYDFPLRLIMLTVFILVKLLALAGVAEILRRLLPVIDESRTLV